MSDDIEVTSDTGPFVIVPEWVLVARISHGAVRLYASLARYADSVTGVAWPSRRTLATRLRVSADTIDRWVKELVSIGAVDVEHRTQDNDGSMVNLSNLYTVRRVAAGGRTDAGRGGGNDAGRGTRTDAAQTRTIVELEQNELTHVKVVFDAWVEATGKDVARTKLDASRRRRIEWALSNYPLDDVVDAVRGWRNSSFHNGENKDRRVYNDLALLLRDSSKLEMFRDYERAGRQVSAPSTWERLAKIVEDEQ
jgi:hypothetical protein